MLNDADLVESGWIGNLDGGRQEYLAECALSNASEENKMKEINVSIEVDDLGKKNQKAGRRKE